MVESALYIVTTYTEMKWLTYDLESTFLQKGYKRGDTLILEIALFKGKREAYQSLVNPVGAVTNGKDLIARLDDEGQSPEKTINFWPLLFIIHHSPSSSTISCITSFHTTTLFFLLFFFYR